MNDPVPHIPWAVDRSDDQPGTKIYESSTESLKTRTLTLLDIAVDHGGASAGRALARRSVVSRMRRVQLADDAAVDVVRRELPRVLVEGEMGGVRRESRHVSAGLIVRHPLIFERDRRGKEGDGQNEGGKREGELDHAWECRRGVHRREERKALMGGFRYFDSILYRNTSMVESTRLRRLWF